MELSHDWVGFQSLFQPHRRQSTTGASGGGPIYLVVDGDVIITAYAEQEDLSDWIGGSHRELVAQHRHRPIAAFDREQADRLGQEALRAGTPQGPDAPLGHAQFYDQVEMLRSKSALVSPDGAAGGRKPEPIQHFLFEAIHGWWAKVLPASYGIYLRIEGRPERHFLLVVRRGSFEAFHEPDLTSIGPDRRRQPADVVKYLSERYLVPVQGVLVSAADWDEWAQLRDPWGLVARSFRAERTRLVPSHLGLRSLIGARTLLGL